MRKIVVLFRHFSRFMNTKFGIALGRIACFVAMMLVWNKYGYSAYPRFNVPIALLAYFGFAILKADPILRDMGNLAISFALLPLALWSAWKFTVVVFWSTRPELNFQQVWFAYIGLYSVIHLISKLFRERSEII